MKARKERGRERVKYRPDYWNNVVSCYSSVVSYRRHEKRKEKGKEEGLFEG